MKSVCVFCAASDGRDPLYSELAAALGALIAARGLRLVYGGARGGMMGALANSALDAGGEVVGVIPEVLGPSERAHTGLSHLHLVADMHARQKLMAELADGFVILPGGLGSLAEFFEIITWKAIKLHNKPIALVNAHGYWTPLLQQIDDAEAQGFLHAAKSGLFTVFNGIEDIGTFFDE